MLKKTRGPSNNLSGAPRPFFLHDPTPGERREGPDCRESILFTREGVQEAAHGLFLLCCRDSPRRSRRASHKAHEGGSCSEKISRTGAGSAAGSNPEGRSPGAAGGPFIRCASTRTTHTRQEKTDQETGRKSQTSKLSKLC